MALREEKGDVGGLESSPPKASSVPLSQTTVFDVTIGESAFANVTSPEELHDKLKDRTVLMLMLDNTDTKRGLLLSSRPQILDNAYFRRNTIEVAPEKLSAYNSFGIPLQSPGQYVVVVNTNDEGATTTALTVLSFNDSYALKLKVLMALQRLDEYQSFKEMGKDLKWLVSSWIQSITDPNRIFWKTVRDKFPELFSIRRFRLEIRDLIDVGGEEKKRKQVMDEKTATVFIQQAKEMETRIEENLKETIKIRRVNLDDYTKLSVEDRKYADSFDEKFKSKRAETYEEDLSKAELTYIANWLSRLDEKGLLIRLWTALATSFDLYHLAWHTPFHRIVNNIDSFGIMGEYLRHLVYLMYKEESNIRHDANTEQRHVINLRHLEELDWLVAPEVYTYVSSGALQPLPKWGTVQGRMNNTNRGVFLSKLRTLEDYKKCLSIISQGTLSDLKISGVYITGGLSSLCLIQSGGEGRRLFTACEQKMKRRRDDRDPIGKRELVLDHLGKKPYYCSDYEEEKQKAFITTLSSTAYGDDTDIDVAVFAEDEKTFLSKLETLQNHIASRLAGLGETKRVLPKFEHYKGDRHRLRLPNSRIIEAFRMFKSTPLAMIFDFHMPPVRHFYDPVKDDVFMLPSCLWAGWTGICLDIKYFGSSKSPLDIILKYMARGYKFILNRVEEGIMNSYIHDPANRELENLIPRGSGIDWLSEIVILSTIRRERGSRIRYVSKTLWSKAKRVKKEVRSHVASFEYPNDPYVELSRVEADEDPELEGEEKKGSDETPEWFKRKLTPPDEKEMVYVYERNEVKNIIPRSEARQLYPDAVIFYETHGQNRVARLNAPRAPRFQGSQVIPAGGVRVYNYSDIWVGSYSPDDLLDYYPGLPLETDPSGVNVGIIRLPRLFSNTPQLDEKVMVDLPGVQPTFMTYARARYLYPLFMPPIRGPGNQWQVVAVPSFSPPVTQFQSFAPPAPTPSQFQRFTPSSQFTLSQFSDVKNLPSPSQFQSFTPSSQFITSSFQQGLAPMPTFLHASAPQVSQFQGFATSSQFTETKTHSLSPRRTPQPSPQPTDQVTIIESDSTTTSIMTRTAASQMYPFLSITYETDRGWVLRKPIIPQLV